MEEEGDGVIVRLYAGFVIAFFPHDLLLSSCGFSRGHYFPFLLHVQSIVNLKLWFHRHVHNQNGGC